MVFQRVFLIFLSYLAIESSLLASCVKATAGLTLPIAEQERILAKAYEILSEEKDRVEKVQDELVNPEAGLIAKDFGLSFYWRSDEIVRAYGDWVSTLLTITEAKLFPLLEKRIIKPLHFEKMLEAIRIRLSAYPDFPFDRDTPYGKFTIDDEIIFKTFRSVYSVSKQREFNEENLIDFIELRGLRKYATHLDILAREASQDAGGIENDLDGKKVDRLKSDLRKQGVEFTEENLFEVAGKLKTTLQALSTKSRDQAERVMLRIHKIILTYPELAKTQDLSRPPFLIAYAFMEGRNNAVSGCCMRGCSGCTYMKAQQLPKELPAMETSSLGFFVALRELRKILPENILIPAKSPNQIHSAIGFVKTTP